jgi:hypothetical protein
MPRRIALPLALLALLAAAPPAAAQRPPLAATLDECRVSPDPALRSAAFTASMPALPRTRRMQMRFVLQQRTADGGYVTLRVPRWGVWQRSRPGVPGFVYTKRVSALRAPAYYRAVVRFRWLDARGRVQRRARRVTAACRQPDLRPDLHAGELAADPGPTPGTASYRFTVANRGRGDAGPFGVVLTANRTPQPEQRLGGLAAGAREVVTLIGPRCTPGSIVRVTVDSASEVVESRERDNAVNAPCPFTGR